MDQAIPKSKSTLNFNATLFSWLIAKLQTEKNAEFWEKEYSNVRAFIE